MCIVMIFVLERALFVLSYALLYLACRTLPSEQSKGAQSLQVTSGAMAELMSLVSSLCSIVLQTVSLLFQWSLSMLALLLVSMLLYIVLQYATDILFEAGIAYNRGIGPSLQVLVVHPLRLLVWFYDNICPLWNAVIWFWKKIPPQLIVETVTHDIGVVTNAVESFGYMIASFATSLISWVQSFTCCSHEGCNQRCFEAGERVFDFLTPMAHLRNLIVWVAHWLRGMCSIMSGPMDLLTFPFMDINFAKGVHFILNSVIYFVFHVPATTVERCKQFSAEGAIMCVPDLEPVFNMAVSGLRYLGLCFDNWLDVLVLIVEGTLGRTSPKCNTIPDLLRDVDFRANMFGSNETVLVGMTEHMFARTDGYGVQYFSTDRDWQTVLHPDAFPFDVNVAYGIAAVSHYMDADHDAKGDDTTALLGCTCSYGSVGVQITCGVAMFGDGVAAAERIINVKFQLPSTGLVLQCNKVMVRVESIRWPVSRFTATKVQRTDGSYAQDVGCSSKGSCLQADAAIWIRPMCSVDGIDLVCVDSFKQASCFPYCMALHVRGSGAQPLVLYDANDWDSGVTLLKRDCGLFSMQPGNNGSAVRVSLPNSAYGLSAGFSASQPCVENPLTISRVPRNVMKEYTAHPSIELENQPFLFANDLALTAVRGQLGADGLPSWSIKVQRIYGSQANEFTMIPLNQNIPSLGPCTTPSNCADISASCQSATGCKPAIPYGYDTSVNAHVLGTTSQRYLFWVTNPSLEPFYAFSAYCRNRNTQNTNMLQISVISSYGGIRLWRMDPYIYCPEINGVRECPEQTSILTKMVESLDFIEFDVSLCDVNFNVMAVDLDYINEDNLALTVMRTTLSNVDTYSLRPLNQSLVEYVTIWVNPNTLEQRNDTMWMPEASSPALSQGFLCPSQRRMPNIGSLTTEAMISLVHFIRLPINLLLSFPVVLEWAGGKCPLLNRGHSVLRNCGSELLSLDDFFSSVFRCNSLFWMALNIIADSFGPGTPQTFINGAAVVGENGNGVAMLPFLSSSLAKAGEVDPAKITSLLANSLSGLPAPIQAGNLAMKNPIANVHFYYRALSRMLMQILEASQASRSVGNVFWNVVAESAKDYDDIVLQRMRRTCGGFSIMAGFNTPLGRLTNRWCTAWVEMQRGFLTMAIVFFVDVPLMDCVCIRSKGSVFASYVKQYCWRDAPDLQKPMLNALMALDHDSACPAVVSMTQLHFKESLDPMFELLEAGARELASVMDSFIGSTGDCNNYADNPYVLTLIPQPVDYFRACGRTELCRLRCPSEFQAFEARNVEAPVTETATQSVQSLFFNSIDDDTYMPVRPLAMLELYNCSYVCGFVQQVGNYRDRCFLLAGESGSGVLEVISFCAPIQIGANVRRGKQSWTVENLVAGALQTGFVFDVNPVEFWDSFRLLVMTEGAINMCHTECVLVTSADEVGAFRFIQMNILGSHIVVNGLKLKSQGSFTTLPASYCFQFTGAGVTPMLECEAHSGEGWPVCVQDETNSCEKALLLPRTSSVPVQSCNREFGTLTDCTTYATKSDFIYKSSITSAGVISQSVLLQGETSVWNIFMTTPPEQKSHWLLMCKVVLDPMGSVAGSSVAGMPAQLTVNLRRKCSLDNCIGCQDLGLQRLCYAASHCQIARCIGTMVHQRRPLCSIGMFLSSTVQNSLSFTEGAWLIVSETMVSVLAASGGVKPPDEITWPDQAFFGYICSAKDMSATAISIITSSINGVVQSVGEMPVAQASQASISNNALIMFSMTMAATTNFLSQIALLPLYMMMATQKIFICNANSILAVVGQDMMSMTLGDSTLQEASDLATGKCMSQYFSENTQGEGTGADNKDSMVAGSVSMLMETYASMKLEFLIHPVDALLTWLQGVVYGLQDIIQTIDRNRWALIIFLFLMLVFDSSICSRQHNPTEFLSFL